MKGYLWHETQTQTSHMEQANVLGIAPRGNISPGNLHSEDVTSSELLLAKISSPKTDDFGTNGLRLNMEM